MTAREQCDRKCHNLYQGTTVVSSWSKSTKILSHDSLTLGSDMNPGPSKYKAEVLSITVHLSVSFVIMLYISPQITYKGWMRSSVNTAVNYTEQLQSDRVHTMLLDGRTLVTRNQCMPVRQYNTCEHVKEVNISYNSTLRQVGTMFLDHTRGQSQVVTMQRNVGMVCRKHIMMIHCHTKLLHREWKCFTRVRLSTGYSICRMTPPPPHPRWVATAPEVTVGRGEAMDNAPISCGGWDKPILSHH
jgi:hypothetical protein